MALASHRQKGDNHTMDQMKVLKRSWEIVWRYRILWAMGYIVALASLPTSNLVLWRTGRGDFRFADFPNGEWFSFARPIPPEQWTQIGVVAVAVAVGLSLLVLALSLVLLIALYVSQTALIRTVDQYEETGERRGLGRAFQLGWSRTAFRLFVIDLLTRLPAIAAGVVLFALGVGAFILIAATEGNIAVTLITLVAGIGLAFLIAFAVAAVHAALSFLRQFFWRACALENLGVVESLRQGFGLVRRHLSDAVMMWLIMFGLELGWSVVIIPVLLILLIVAALVAVPLALLVAWLVGLLTAGGAPWVAAMVVGVPVFVIVLVVPLLFLGGLAEVFKSSVWTLTYRELRALEAVAPAPARSAPARKVDK